jgi:glutamate-5-semialdehyde dehydrogenase
MTPIDTTTTEGTMAEVVEAIARKGRRAGLRLARASREDRDQALRSVAEAVERAANVILVANETDLAAADERGIQGSMRDRLTIYAAGVQKLADAIREVAAQDDPLGGLEDETVRPNGLRVARMRIPLGVVAMIYESRPNVTADAAALCIKSGNAVILRGGSEAIHSNRAIADAIREGLEDSEVPVDAVQLIPITDRAAVSVLLQQEKWIDLVIPRGGESLIRAVTRQSRIPVLQHYKGVCHLFLDATAPLERAVAITRNAKVQRPGVCNSLETLLVHADAADRLLPPVVEQLLAEGVEVRGCERTREVLTGRPVVAASEADWEAEYLDLTLAVRIVPDLEGALEHIAKYGSSHTEAIVTDDQPSADLFVAAVQSSTVLVNASTRFADGGELGLGAEIGISTSKLHAFGPMGARELTTRKFVVIGDGHVRG